MKMQKTYKIQNIKTNISKKIQHKYIKLRRPLQYSLIYFIFFIYLFIHSFIHYIQWKHHLVNVYEVKAGMVFFAG